MLFLFGCKEDSVEGNTREFHNPHNDPVNITIEEANQIALEQAEIDGIDNPILSEWLETKIQSKYSIKYDRDMKIYSVYIRSGNRAEDYTVDGSYYISTETGEFIESTH